MDDVGGPRDHLANERTHLAWVRTALAVTLLGLAVARFGDNGSVSLAGLVSGAVLVAAGASVLAYGSTRYRATARELERGEFGTARSTTGPVVATTVLLAAVVVALVILLLADL
ncbi:MAG: DUF202 domain-containing protein [Aeromicrobium erythreum]